MKSVIVRASMATCAILYISLASVWQDKRVMKFLGDTPSLTHAGQDVTLTITTDNISMISLDSKRTILHHSMEEISFASGGDSVCVIRAINIAYAMRSFIIVHGS